MIDMDFIGFTYNGYHSSSLGIYRTSDGSRYNENLITSLNDKTADVPGSDGQYYFYTSSKNKTFSISYAFDSLTEGQLRQLKQVFDGRGIHDLIFDEAPYKTWSAKVTGNASIKHISFTDGHGNRVYKGEGSLQFTCYWPFAKSSNLTGIKSNANTSAAPTKTWLPCHLFTQPGSAYQLINNCPCAISIRYAEKEGLVWSEDKIADIAISSSRTFSKITWIKEVRLAAEGVSAIEGARLTLSGESYYYTSCGGFEYTGTNGDGRNINHYPLSIFPTKGEWGAGSGMLNTPYNGENYGDIPAHFIYKNRNSFIAGTKIVLTAVPIITIQEACSNIEWDSKTGLIIGTTSSGRRPVAYSGNALATLPVGANPISLNTPSGGVLEYNYWYY